MGTWSLNVPENGDLVTLLPGERNQESHLPSHIEIPLRKWGPLRGWQFIQDPLMADHVRRNLSENGNDLYG